MALTLGTGLLTHSSNFTLVARTLANLVDRLLRQPALQRSSFELISFQSTGSLTHSCSFTSAAGLSAFPYSSYSFTSALGISVSLAGPNQSSRLFSTFL